VDSPVAFGSPPLTQQHDDRKNHEERKPTGVLCHTSTHSEEGLSGSQFPGYGVVGVGRNRQATEGHIPGDGQSTHRGRPRQGRPADCSDSDRQATQSKPSDRYSSERQAPQRQAANTDAADRKTSNREENPNATSPTAIHPRATPRR
jgi:hypothetical protein